MEKITKEELLEKLSDVPLSDDELEKIAGGANSSDCAAACYKMRLPAIALKACVERCAYL